jgi:hypothetical protein
MKATMRNSLLRPFLILEFLVAIDAVYTLWSEVGGQVHLDLMFWPWKLVLGVGAAALITLITGQLARNDGRLTRRALMFCSLLIALVLTAGVVTYYYHLNEPTEQDDDSDEDAPAQISSLSARHGPRHFKHGGSSCREASTDHERRITGLESRA